VVPDHHGVVTRHYPTTTQARSEFKALLDAALAGRVVTVTRETERYTVVDTGRLLVKLMQARPARAVVVAEGGGWVALLPDLPIHGEGDSFDEAIDDLMVALREYAEDWNERLYSAPNHRDHWDVAEIAELAGDEQLKAWLVEPASLSQ
jgi:predicted RNase H-like HicB family nuclease